MAVKHTPTGEVHSGNKGGKTGCGFDTRDNPSLRKPLKVATHST